MCTQLIHSKCYTDGALEQVCIEKEENKPVEEEIQDDFFVDDLTSGGVNK